MLQDIGALAPQPSKRRGCIDAEQVLGQIGYFHVHDVRLTIIAVVRSLVCGVTFRCRFAAQRFW